MIDELSSREGIVLATGGGSVLAATNRDCLKSRGFVVYLRASLSQQIERTGRDRNRPLLQTADPQARISAIFEQRDPIYRELAHLVIETGSPSLHSLVNRLEAQLVSRQAQATDPAQ